VNPGPVTTSRSSGFVYSLLYAWSVCSNIDVAGLDQWFQSDEQFLKDM